MSENQPMEARIRRRLEAAFDVQELDVINESHLHAGHAGDDGSGESHFRLRLQALGLDQMSRVERHRAVHKALGPLTGEIHALALELS